MTSDYYSRPFQPDGSYANAEDHAAEDCAFRAVEAAADNVQVYRFEARYMEVEGYVIRDGNLCGFLEVKHRSHRYGTYGDVWLNLRKWFALTNASISFGVPSLFLVHWTDCLGWVPVREVETRNKLQFRGCSRVVKARQDAGEPVIPIPVGHFHRLTCSCGPRP